MENLFLQFFVFAAATFMLVKSADMFIDNAVKVGSALRLPHFLIGVLIVSVGTSLPELATGIAAVSKGETDLLVGNVMGSNIANIFLGLGLVLFLANKDLPFKQNVFRVHLPVLIMSTVSAVLIAWDQIITPWEGVILLGIMGAYIWFLFAEDQGGSTFAQHEKFKWSAVVLTIVSLVILIVASKFVIDSVIALADILGFAKTALSASLVAIGTSLPEMMVVFSALKKNKQELVIGNILGSNIFNILMILGVGSLIAPLTVSDLSYKVIMPFMLGATIIYWMISVNQRITRQEGLAMTFIYLLFLGKLFGFF